MINCQYKNYRRIINAWVDGHALQMRASEKAIIQLEDVHLAQALNYQHPK